MIAVDGISVQHSIFGNQAMRTLGQENLVAEWLRASSVLPRLIRSVWGSKIE